MLPKLRTGWAEDWLPACSLLAALPLWQVRTQMTQLSILPYPDKRH